MMQSKKILIIEDDDAAAESIELICREMGFDTLVARDGTTGLEMANAERPNLILSDIAMPGLDGFEVARRIRDNHDLDETAIVAVTGHPPHTPAKNQKIFDDYVIKPYSAEDLGEVINKFCRPAPPPMG